MQTLHTSDSMSEFIARLVEAIKAKKSPVQTAKRLIVEGVLNGSIIAFKRDADDKLITVEDTSNGVKTTTLVPADLVDGNGAKIGVNGFVTNVDLQLAVVDIYHAATFSYESAVLEKEAKAEINTIIKTAARCAADELGLVKAEKKDSGMLHVDKNMDVGDFAIKLMANFSPEYLIALTDQVKVLLEADAAIAA